ncbi:MAG: ribosome silencing factor [Clostridia bacterium]|nr:ribosome silencing factor [Clostridia bacterium]
MTSLEKAKHICALLSEKQAKSIKYIDVANETTLCDYFVIASGRSSIQVKTLAEHVDEKMEEIDEAPRRKEGMREGRWSVLDFGDVMVHVFDDEQRDFYDLERLWTKGDNVYEYVD